MTSCDVDLVKMFTEVLKRRKKKQWLAISCTGKLYLCCGKGTRRGMDVARKKAFSIQNILSYEYLDYQNNIVDVSKSPE